MTDVIVTRMAAVRQRRIRNRLVSWYRENARDLPWRRTRDPYLVWVSETMLQQTQVATVLPYYLRFTERFPDLPSLAGAPIDQVLPYWSGLGYYRRIRNLHAAARLVVARYEGRVPRDRQSLLTLPGVGRYTAGAILSLAFGQAEPLVDGNVARVLSRVLALRGDPSRAPNQNLLWTLAGSLVAGEDPGAFNQAMMELGALICLPRRPKCEQCPVESWCEARRIDLTEAIPDKAASRRTESVLLAAFLVRRGGRLLILKRDNPTLMTGLWELPMIRFQESPLVHERDLTLRYRSEFGMDLSGIVRIGELRHSVTYRRIRVQVFEARHRGAVSTEFRGSGAAAWLDPSRIDRYGMSSLALKAIRLLRTAETGSQDKVRPPAFHAGGPSAIVRKPIHT